MITSKTIIDARNPQGELFRHLWSVGVGAGRANEGLRAGWLEQLQMVHDNCGFRYVRMHGLFDDDMFVYFEDEKGGPIYNWQYVDEVYDRMLAIGVRPFVELAFFPEKIAADNSRTQMWYRNRITYDPSRLEKWEGLVREFTQHVVDRYGIDEVSTWYFEVWNEPNLNRLERPGFWDGTKEDYFELYRASARAVKSVDLKLRVGGPATSNFIADARQDGPYLDDSKSTFFPQDVINKQQWKGVWIEEFLDFCQKNSLPVDFVSTHAYPTDFALDPVFGAGRNAVRYVHSVHDDLSWLKSVISRSGYPQAEAHITEWNVTAKIWDQTHDILPAAVYVIKVNLDNIGMADSIMHWTFTDIFEERGGGQTPFCGLFGMINFQGIVKPVFHAYRMLNRLGDEKLYYKDPLFVSRDSRTGKVKALAFNYPDEHIDAVPSAAIVDNYMENASSKTVNLTLTGLKPGSRFIFETLDKEHGNVLDEYKSIGAPSQLSREQTSWLKERAWQTDSKELKADNNGELNVALELKPWSCVLIEEK